MYRKIVWCYLIVLTLLDISLNTKSSAQGKSHGNGVSVHESFMEEISLQEWGSASIGARGGGRAAPVGTLALQPPALEFGAAPLATAHARTVTLTNTGNETVHLASVAGTAPDFHASFFESKTLVPAANTTFTVVYLGRREGPVASELYIHTSKGVLRYPVSAEGAASAWRVWPLVGLRVPLNASLEPLLTLYNPTDAPVQVNEVRSSGAWLGLRLPGGGTAAPRAHWTLPPRAARDLVRLTVRAPDPRAPRLAYVRIKTNVTGGGLVVAVEATPAPAGEYLLPLQLRLRPRGAGDPPDTFELQAGNSDGAPVRLEAEVWGARCGPAPPGAAPEPPAVPPPPAPSPAHSNGGRAAEGARLTLLTERLAPHAPPARAAALTLDYGALWAGAEAGPGGAWCSGWARVGRAAAPYSVRVLPGTLRLAPDELRVVTAAEDAAAQREVRAHNLFPLPLLVERVDFPPEVEELFHTESLAPLVLPGGAQSTVARVRLRAGATGPLRARISVRTNCSDYELPLLLLDGRLHIEWEWGGAADGALQLGAVSASSTRRVRARLRNAGPASLCVAALEARLPGARFELARPDEPCVEPAAWADALLTVVAPARAGPVAGAVRVRTDFAFADCAVELHVHEGRLTAPPLLLDDAAPYVWARAPLVLESSMELRMRVTELAQPPPADPALFYIPPAEEAAEVAAGSRAVGTVVYAAERACGDACATGLAGAERAAWLARGALPGGGALAADRALLAARRALLPLEPLRLPLLLHTSGVRALPAAARVRWAWPALAARGAGDAGLAAVGGAAELLVRVRNPSERPLLVQPLLPPAAAWALAGWRGAAPWPDAPAYALLPPRGAADVALTFAPQEAGDLAAHLYLRNNLTIVEDVPLSGRGEHPRFELGGRRPNSSAAIVLEASECGTVRRSLLLRNTGAVRLRLREWRLAGGGCRARGFRLQPCGPLELAPNDTRTLTLAFTPDWTRARAAAPLTVRAGPGAAAFTVAGAAPARLLARCAARAPRPPFEPALRTLGGALALLALAGAVALGALDAERALRRHRAAREPPPPRAPLDLRALARPEPAPARAPSPPPTRRRRTPRRRGAPLDAAAERRAFERWRADVTRRATGGDESRSSDESRAAVAPVAASPRGDASSSSPDSSPAPRAAPPRYRPRDSASDSSEPEERAPPPADRSASDSPTPGAAEPECARPPPPHAAARGSTGRLEGATGRPARSGGAEGRARARSGSARTGARKERGARRRARATSPGPAAAASPASVGGRAPPAVRWGASWSSVVSRGAAADAPPEPRAPAPLAPIGSDVPRRAGSHSLFYYGAAEPPPEPRECAWPPRPAPPRDDDAGYRSLESVWGASMEPHPAAAAWLWGGGAPGAVRPPPGFAPRDYDPFHSLASIWTPATLDWRRRDPADREPAGESAPADAGPSAE